MNSSIRLKRYLFLSLIILNAGFTVVTACASQKLETAVLTITRADSSIVEITVEIARTDEEKARGLMYRKELADGRGMIFVYDRDQALSFWMENTTIPLSIAFIASDGRIVEIRDMRPLDRSSVRSSRMVRYALETPQGWFERAGVQAGDVINPLNW